MSRIQKAFENKKAFIAFLTAGENRNSAGIYDVFESGVPLRLRSVF